MKQKMTTIMARKQTNRNTWKALIIIVVGLFFLLMLIACGIACGASDISLGVVLDALLRFNHNNRQHLIIVELRLPRAIASALVGVALSVAGAIMQGITRNPMADSGLMGLNAGAGFALAICFALFPELTYMQRVMACFAGAAFGAIVVNGIASMRRGNTSFLRFVLAGVAVSALLTAFSQGIALMFDVSQDIMFWTVGGFCALTWKQIFIMTPCILGALICAVVIAPKLSLISLSDEVAMGLGLNIVRIHMLCSVIVVLLAGISVSVVGAVSFVGLIIPHIARFLVGVDYRLVIPTSAVLGSVLMVAADLGSRMINPPFELPIGSLIAVIGAPFFLYLARKERRMEE